MPISPEKKSVSASQHLPRHRSNSDKSQRGGAATNILQMNSHKVTEDTEKKGDKVTVTD